MNLITAWRAVMQSQSDNFLYSSIKPYLPYMHVQMENSHVPMFVETAFTVKAAYIDSIRNVHFNHTVAQLFSAMCWMEQLYRTQQICIQLAGCGVGGPVGGTLPYGLRSSQCPGAVTGTLHCVRCSLSDGTLNRCPDCGHWNYMALIVTVSDLTFVSWITYYTRQFLIVLYCILTSTPLKLMSGQYSGTNGYTHSCVRLEIHPGYLATFEFMSCLDMTFSFWIG